MLALAYDAGLRREELCALRTDDLDPARRLLRVRAETTKAGASGSCPYSAPTRRTAARLPCARGGLSHGPRPAVPVGVAAQPGRAAHTLDVVQGRAPASPLAAGVPRFAHAHAAPLCLTDLARAGWELHAIATFAGHRNPPTTLLVHPPLGPRARRQARARHGADPRLARRACWPRPEPAERHERAGRLLRRVRIRPRARAVRGRAGGAGRAGLAAPPTREPRPRGPNGRRDRARLSRRSTPRGSRLRDRPTPGSTGASSLDAVGLVLRRCAEEGTAYWGWPAEDWVRLIG